MRLSEQIAIGRVLIKPKVGGRRSNKSDKGCALDMAMAATYGGCWHEAWRVWPWLKEPANRQGLPYIWADAIAHRFDHEVMGRKTLTMDAFIDWVRSVEPAEESPAEAPQPDTELIQAT